MGEYTVGDRIREARERQKYTQEELCYGICTPSTLSRIENGIQVPGRKILEALTQRLGITNVVWDTYLSKEEMQRYEAVRKLMRSLENHNFEQSEEFIRRIEKVRRTILRNSPGTRLEKQSLLFARALIENHRGEKKKQVLEILLHAINVTIPDFDGIHIKGRLLTFQEISILNKIGCIYHDLGRIVDAFRILYELKEYMEVHSSEGEEKPINYSMVLQTIVVWMGQEGWYEDALLLCERGIRCSIEDGKSKIFPSLLYHKASVLAELGRLEGSRDCFTQVIAILHAMNQPEWAEKIRRRANVSYNLKL